VLFKHLYPALTEKYIKRIFDVQHFEAKTHERGLVIESRVSVIISGKAKEKLRISCSD